MGQKKMLRSHPIYLDNLGEECDGNYINDSIFNRSWNRGISVRNSKGFEIKHNTFVNIYGHGIFFETGTEEDITVEGNLVHSVLETWTGR